MKGHFSFLFNFLRAMHKSIPLPLSNQGTLKNITKNVIKQDKTSLICSFKSFLNSELRSVDNMSTIATFVNAIVVCTGFCQGVKKENRGLLVILSFVLLYKAVRVFVCSLRFQSLLNRFSYLCK